MPGLMKGLAMQYLPLNYEQINIAAGSYNPSPIKAYNNWSYGYWQRSLFNRVMAVYDFKLPEEWGGSTRSFYYYCLIRWGYVTVFNRAKYGVIFQPCNLSAYNLYYQPVKCLVSNPAFEKGLELTIGTDCELIRLTPDYIGLWDIISRYAQQLSELDNAINIALVNSKFAWILGAHSKSAAEAAKKAIDKINKGEPAVVVDTKLTANNKPNDDAPPWEHLEFDVKGNYILTDLLTDFQTIMNAFDAEIGIPTVPYQKKERMVTEEATSRQYDSSARAIVSMDCLKHSIRLVNDMFGTDISVTLRYPDPTQVEVESEVTDNVNE